MKKGLHLLRLLLGVQVGLCIAILATGRIQDCGSCARGSDIPAVLGILFYGILFARSWIGGLTVDLVAGVLFGAGVHVALMAQLLAHGRFCPWCLATASMSALMGGSSILADRANLGRLLLILPASALLVTAGWSWMSPAPISEGPDDRVQIRVYVQPDCPFCEELRSRVLPDIEKEFGDRVSLRVFPAEDLPSVRRTPTLLLQSRRVKSDIRVIEGLPTVERLRSVIRELETAP